MWLEAVLGDGLTWSDGRPLQSFEPFEVSVPLSIGPPGTAAHLEWSARNRATVSPAVGGLVFTDDYSVVSQSGGRLMAAPWRATARAVWRSQPTGEVMLRVLGSATDSCGWPSTLPRPAAPWSDATLLDLEALLRGLGLAVAQRFGARVEAEDKDWLPLITGLSGDELCIGWRRGVVDELTVAQPASAEFGRALARHAVCIPLRRLVLRCRPGIEPAPVLTGVIEAGGLPCLEAIQCQVAARWRKVGPRALEESLRALPGFAAAFPAIRSVLVTEDLPEMLTLSLRR